jgi:hypothetical protein
VLLDQVPPQRLYHALGVIGAIAFGLTVCFVAGLPVVNRRRIAVTAAVATFVATAAAGARFTIQDAPLPGGRVVIVAVVVAVAVGATIIGLVRSGAVALATLAVAVTLFANPLQRGLGPLTDSPALAEINAEAERSPGVWWVSTSDVPADIAVLTASQAPMISGPSVYPNEEIWLRIDPDRSEAASWNSFSHVMVDALPDGAATTMSREADILHLGLDLCGADAAALEIGRAVLPPGDPLPSCATSVEQLDGPSGPLQLVTIVP